MVCNHFLVLLIMVLNICHRYLSKTDLDFCIVYLKKDLYCFLSLTVYADGSICLDILQNRWSPTYDVSSILTSIQVI